MAVRGQVVGVDVGGTFTDLIVVDPGSQSVRVAKVPTTLDNQAHGVMAALAEAEVALDRVANISHGTTTTTNALLERKLAVTGLITTAGFRDVLELGRRTRPQPYGLIGQFTPLIPRDRRLEVPERMDAEGYPLVALDEAAMRDAVIRLRAAGCDALVIHFLHSYRNPAHENRAAEIAAAHWPNDYISVGHKVLSEFREFERGTAAAVNAAVQPILDRYLVRLRERLERSGFDRDLLVMQGNGGSVAASMAARAAVNTVMSGPASGVMAAAAQVRLLGRDRLITYDMGGTSSDVGLVIDGVPQVTAEIELAYGMPIHVPMVDVHSIGAGGGSIAQVSKAGLLEVGPESAGADPGPICYGRGGAQATITDANLALGRLDPAGLLAVEGASTPAAIRNAIAEQIGAPLDLAPDQAAAAILRIANDQMAGAVRMVTLARGHDPRDYALFAFGGAGPMHACALARELAVPTVIVPPRPGITNAIGCVTADLRHDFVRTVNTPLDRLDIATVNMVLDEQEAEGRKTVIADAVPVESVEVSVFADMQFDGQTHILTVPVSREDLTVAKLRDAFEHVYWDRFGVDLPEIRAVLVNLHTVVIGCRPALPARAFAGDRAAETVAEACLGVREVWFAEAWCDAPVYDRTRLPVGQSFVGPAILQQTDCTTVIEPGDRAERDGLGNIVIEIGS